MSVAAGALVALVARGAHASPCDDALGRAFTGPPEVGVREAGLGAPREPCRRREVFARLDGVATVDTPDFYGTLGGAARVGLRWALPWPTHLEVSADATLVDVRFAQNASVKVTERTYGPIAVGLLWQGEVRAFGWPLALAPALRLVAPGTHLGVDGQRGGAELALHAGARPLAWLSLDAHAGALALLFAADDDTTAAHTQAFVAAGAGFVVSEHLALLAGLEAAAGFHGGGLDHLLGRGGVRLTTRGAGRWDLAAVVPFAGAERTDVALTLAWSSRL